MKNWFILSFLLLCAVSGCSTSKSNQEKMVVQIRSSKKTNRGTPLYMIIKETTMADFINDDYHQIATQSYWKDEDQTKLTKKVLVPGRTDQVDLELSSDEKSVGIYFIFTNPGECWKHFIDSPKSKKVKILLGDHESEEINVYES